MSKHEITQLLLDWSAGHPDALDRLLPQLYDQLRRLAHHHLRGERSGHTLNTTGLVHEAFLKLIELDRIEWQDRAHFLAMASRTMRRILIDQAHRRKALKRGGDRHRVPLEEEMLLSEDQAQTLLDLDAALQRLEAVNARQAHVVEHRYFGGLQLEETASVLDVSLATVKRDLRFARAWLARELSEPAPF